MHPVILLATIAGSGTNHALQCFGRQRRFLTDDWRSDLRHGAHGIVLVAHLDDEVMPTIQDLAEEMPVWTTFRAKHDVRETWKKRGLLPGQEARFEAQQLNLARLMVFCEPNVINLGARWPKP